MRVPEPGARQSDNVHVGEWSLVARVTCTTADTGRWWQLLAELFVIYTCTKDRIGGRGEGHDNLKVHLKMVGHKVLFIHNTKQIITIFLRW